MGFDRSLLRRLRQLAEHPAIRSTAAAARTRKRFSPPCATCWRFPPITTAGSSPGCPGSVRRSLPISTTPLTCGTADPVGRAGRRGRSGRAETAARRVLRIQLLPLRPHGHPRPRLYCSTAPTTTLPPVFPLVSTGLASGRWKRSRPDRAALPRADEDDQPIAIFSVGSYAREEAFEQDLDLFALTREQRPEFSRYATELINDLEPGADPPRRHPPSPDDGIFRRVSVFAGSTGGISRHPAGVRFHRAVAVDGLPPR